VVTPYDLSHEGGVGRHARSLAAALQGLGHEAWVLGPASGAVPPGCDGVPGVVPVRANGSVARIGLFTAGHAVRDHLRRGRYDLVHVHEPLVPGPSRLAVGLARVPVVATFHASAEAEPLAQRLLRRAAAGGLGRVAAGIAVSLEAKRFARAVYRGPVAVIPNGVDLSRFAPASATTTDAGPAGPAAAEPLRVLFVGRYGESRKGLEVLLGAARRLVESGRPVELTVVGDGPRERVRAAAGSLPVRFAGRLDDAALAAAYAGAGVFCAPSLGGESFGMVLVEAMASGCPVVASAIPGYAEAARGAARLVPPNDAAALAEALWSAGRDPAERQRLIRLGLRRAPALDWPHVARRVVRVYLGALRRAGPVVSPARVAPAEASP
jgi:phosphatidylinositol alpha-mannosyltransferase